MHIALAAVLALTLWWPIPLGILIISWADKSGIYKLGYKTKQILVSYVAIAIILCFTALGLDGALTAPWVGNIPCRIRNNNIVFKNIRIC